MALIKSFHRRHMDRNSIHDAIDAKFTSFERDGRVFIQIDSYGRQGRKRPYQKSQSIQLDRASAITLSRILRREFHLD
jgi:hypothetical protein